ncbi:MAG: helix-hairpin-helix domain-containing protein [Candidatus Thermoplasmatota archaeon]
MQEEKGASEENTSNDLTSIPSVGNLTARALIDAEYDSISKLKEADVENLSSLDHIGKKLAKKILEEVNESSSDQEIDENISSEFRCPVCNSFTWSEGDECRECEEPIEFISSVVLPEEGIIEEPRKTLAEVEKKILNDGGDAESWFIRGSILESMGANRKALESYDRVIELDPLYDYVWNAKAQVSLKIGETEEAAKAYKLAFDFRKAPKDIADQIEETKPSASKEITKFEEKEDIDKELDEKISRARKLLRRLECEEIEISEMTTKLDTVTEERIKGNKEKALEMVTDIIEKCESESEIEEETQELLDKIEKVDGFSEELSEETRDLIGIKDDISRAEDAVKEGKLEEASELISSYLENKSSLRYISENLNEMKAMRDKIEEQNLKLDFLDGFEQDFEKVKELCRNEDYQEAKDVSEDLIDELEENLEYIEKVTEGYLKEIEETFEKGEKKGFDLETVKNEFDVLIEKFETGKEEREEIIKQFEALKEEVENTFSLKSNISEIKDLLDEHQESLDMTEYEEEIDKIEDISKEGDFEKAIDLSKELKEDIETEIEKPEEKEDLESKADSKISEARKKLSELRETEFDLNNLKRLLKNSNESKESGDLEKSIALTEEFIDSANKMIELSNIIEKADKKIEELEEKDLVDKERINYEIDQYRGLIQIEKYGLAEKFLSETLEELKEALEEEKIIPSPEEKLDKSATEIPTQIKEKVRNVKELNNLVEEAEIEIKVNREPLKDAIIKIKDLEYQEADEILVDWKASLIDRLNYELGDRLETLNRRMDESDITSIQRRGKAILENVERKWKLKEYEEALETLVYASSFIQDIKRKDAKEDKQIYLNSKLIEDIQESDESTKEIEDLLSKAKENKDEEVLEETFEDIKEKTIEHLKDTVEDEIEELEDRLEGLNRKKVVEAISNLIDVKSSLDKENPEKAAWYLKEYKDVIEEV